MFHFTRKYFKWNIWWSSTISHTSISVKILYLNKTKKYSICLVYFKIYNWNDHLLVMVFFLIVKQLRQFPQTFHSQGKFKFSHIFRWYLTFSMSVIKCKFQLFYFYFLLCDEQKQNLFHTTHAYILHKIVSINSEY